MSWHVGASDGAMAAAAPAFALTWRTFASPLRKQKDFEFVTDLDLHGTTVAVLGARRDEAGKFAPDGAIAWVGSLGQGLDDLKPLLFDAGGPQAPNMNKCALCFLGATRFQPDGSLVVIPGVQPGIDFFSPKGKLVRTMDSVALGIDTDCSGVTAEQKSNLSRHTTARMDWVNARRIVDDILPFPQGPGVLIRSLVQGRVEWLLKVLKPDGSVSSFKVPLRGQSTYAHLKGDFQRGKLVLLLWEYAPDGGPEGAPIPHLFQFAWPTQ